MEKIMSKIYSVRDNQVFNLEGLGQAAGAVHIASCVAYRIGEHAATQFAVKNGLHPKLVALALKLEQENSSINRYHVGKRYISSQDDMNTFVDQRFGTVAV
jgi:hypothetical protein